MVSECSLIKLTEDQWQLWEKKKTFSSPNEAVGIVFVVDMCPRNSWRGSLISTRIVVTVSPMSMETVCVSLQ